LRLARNTIRDAFDRLLPSTTSKASTHFPCGFRCGCRDFRRSARPEILLLRFTPRGPLRRMRARAMRALSSLHAVANTEPLTLRHPTPSPRAARSRVRDPKLEPDRDRIHLAPREWDEPLPAKSAFPRRIPFTGLHRSRNFAAAIRITTPFRRPRGFRSGLGPWPRNRRESTALLETGRLLSRSATRTRPVSTFVSPGSPRATGPIARPALLLQ
jgi:hypothetical protein